MIMIKTGAMLFLLVVIKKAKLAFKFYETLETAEELTQPLFFNHLFLLVTSLSWKLVMT